MTTSKEEIQWLQGLQSFLNKLLQPIIPENINRNKYLGKDAMITWANAFTHETFSPSDNYEDLEFLGDAILKCVFPKYLMKRLPYLHKGEYTELNSTYMSKMMQGQLSRKMGLNEHIRFKGLENVNFNLEADVFESFFGALDTISDSLLPGLGFANCYNLIIHLFKDITIDETKGKGSFKTQVIQMFVRFDLPSPKEQSPGSEISIYANQSLLNNLRKSGVSDNLIGHSISNKNKDAEYEAYHQVITLLSSNGLISVEKEKITTQTQEGIEFSVSLRNEHIDFLHNYDINVENPVIGYSTAATKKEAEYNAYNQAYNTLAKYGITTEWAEKTKQLRDLADPDINKLLPTVESKLKQEGFQSMYFFIPRKTVTTKGAIVQLVGVRANGKHEVISYIHTSDRENSYRNAKLQVVQQYVYHQ